jgi:uncharacterized OB-fold protein
VLEIIDGSPYQKGMIRPMIDVDSELWWAGLADGQLLLPRCMHCERFWFPPAPACPACGACHFTWIPASGRGSLYSWVVVRRSLDARFDADIPYTVTAVDLEEGPRLFGRLLEGYPAAGLALDAVVYLVSGSPLLGFRPAA